MYNKFLDFIIQVYNMIKLVLLTDFIGTGKTTLMKSILNTYKDKKVGVIV